MAEAPALGKLRGPRPGQPWLGNRAGASRRRRLSRSAHGGRIRPERVNSGFSRNLVRRRLFC